MRILLLTQWFDPEPTFKGLAFAKELVARGHEVEVLTGFPNYPGGRVYPGYRIRWRQRELVEGIPVTRVALYPSHDRSAVRRAANYLSFALSAATIGAFTVRRPDVVYAYHPPATIALAAMVLKWFRGVPFVLDIQDLWPDTLTATGMMRSRAALGIIGMFCRLAYRSAARVVVLSPGFNRLLVDRGVPADKLEVIYNWCDEAAITNANPSAAVLEEACLDGRFNVVFAGTMGKAQALSSVLHAAKLVEACDSKVQFTFVGGGIEVEALKREAMALGLGNVRFLSRRPPAEIGPLLHAADVLLVHLSDSPLFAITIPSKTQAYMAVGRPILMAVRGDAADLIRQAGAGVCTCPENPRQLADAVCELAQAPAGKLAVLGERGKAFYEQYLSLQAGVGHFEKLLESAARGA